MECAKKNLGIAVIGCGGRAKEVIKAFIKAADGYASVSIAYDLDSNAVEKARVAWKMSTLNQASSLETAVNAPNVDLVAIFTPNSEHCSAILAALAARKQVFSEKPLATTLEDCERIMVAEQESGISIMTGFVLRYAPIYRKIKELLDSGTFGKILNIAASENRESSGGGASMSADYGWRRFREKAGPYLLEKCCHDLDLLNWYAGCLPHRVAAFCGLDFFIPEYSELWNKYDKENFAALVPNENRINPFTSPKNIYDNHSVIMEYPNGIKMSFQLTLANASPERRMYISCTEGTIIAESISGVLAFRRYDEPYETRLVYYGGGHGGGDQVMAKEIMGALLSGKKIVVSGSQNGSACAKVALAADESARTGKIVTC